MSCRTENQSAYRSVHIKCFLQEHIWHMGWWLTSMNAHYIHCSMFTYHIHINSVHIGSNHIDDAVYIFIFTVPYHTQYMQCIHFITIHYRSNKFLLSHTQTHTHTPIDNLNSLFFVLSFIICYNLFSCNITEKLIKLSSFFLFLSLHFYLCIYFSFDIIFYGADATAIAAADLIDSISLLVPFLLPFIYLHLWWWLDFRWTVILFNVICIYVQCFWWWRWCWCFCRYRCCC